MTSAPRKTPAILAVAATLMSGVWTVPTQALDQAGPPRPPQACGQSSLTGQAPDIMTYDSRSGTQVFVDQGNRTNITAYNARTRSATQMNGDLSQHGTPDLCTVDGTPGGDAYSLRPQGDSAVLTGFDGKTGQTWRMDGDGSLQRENDCFKMGLGLFAGTRGNMVGLGPTIAVGRDFAGVGLSVGNAVIAPLAAKDGMIGAGVLSC